MFAAIAFAFTFDLLLPRGVCTHRFNALASCYLATSLRNEQWRNVRRSFFGDGRPSCSPPVVIIVSRKSPNRSAHLIHRSRLLDACSTAFRSSTCLTCCRKTLSPRQRSAALTRSHLSPINDENYFAVVVLCPSRSLRRERCPRAYHFFSTPAFSGTITHPALRVSRILRRCPFHAHSALREIIWCWQNVAALFSDTEGFRQMLRLIAD